MGMNAKELIGNPEYPAISYGGYREKSESTNLQLMKLKKIFYYACPRF